MEKRLSESDLKAPTLIHVVAKHEQQIQELKRLVTPISMNYEEGYEAGYKAGMDENEKREWVGLTDEELLDAYGWKEKVEKNRFWEDTNPMLEKARQDMLFELRKVESLLKEKNGG